MKTTPAPIFWCHSKTIFGLFFSIFLFQSGVVSAWSEDSATLKQELGALLEKNGYENFIKDMPVLRTASPHRFLAVKDSCILLVGDRFFDSKNSDELRLMFLLHEMGHLVKKHSSSFESAKFGLCARVGLVAALALNMTKQRGWFIEFCKKVSPLICVWGAYKLNQHLLSPYARMQEIEADEIAIQYAPNNKHRIAYLEYFMEDVINAETYEKKIIDYLAQHAPCLRSWYFSFLQWKWDPEHPANTVRFQHMKKFILKNFPGEIVFEDK